MDRDRLANMSRSSTRYRSSEPRARDFTIPFEHRSIASAANLIGLGTGEEWLRGLVASTE